MRKCLLDIPDRKIAKQNQAFPCQTTKATVDFHFPDKTTQFLSTVKQRNNFNGKQQAYWENGSIPVLTPSPLVSPKLWYKEKGKQT